MKINQIVNLDLRKLFNCRRIIEYLEFSLCRKIFNLNYSKILDFHLFYLHNYLYLLNLDHVYNFLQNFFAYFEQTYYFIYKFLQNFLLNFNRHTLIFLDFFQFTIFLIKNN